MNILLGDKFIVLFYIHTTSDETETKTFEFLLIT